MSKVIVMVRTSTDKQSTEDQHREMEEFCIAEGWRKKDIVWVEEEGASAAKVDDAYRGMIERVKEEVEKDPDIKCFAVWHLNRLARTEEMWIEIKRFFVSHKVQIICKNPYLRLLTPDGRVDAGMELAMGLLAILSKQDNDERKAKFKRAKTAMMKQGKYVGGNCRKYGYKVDENNFFVENEEESKVVKTIFDLYSTGRYSIYTLGKELRERGMDVSDNLVQKAIGCKAYIGEEVADEKKARIVDSYMDGLIDKKGRDLRLEKVEDDIHSHRNTLSALQEQKRGIARLLATETETDTVEAFEAALDTMDAESKYDIVHKHIVSLTAEPVSFGKRDPRTHKPNAVDIKITSASGRVHKFLYVPKYYEGHNLFVWSKNKWMGDYVLIPDKKTSK